MDFAPPRPGDIVHCSFPKGKLPEPGPKQRPALVLEVEKFPNGTCDVIVAYGTSQGTGVRYPGEFTVSADEPGAGLSRDTKFDLRQAARLPFNEKWFAVAPNQPFGRHPKRGKLDFTKLLLKRKLQAAVAEAKRAGAFDFLDVAGKRADARDPERDGITPSAKRTVPGPNK